MPFDDTNPPLPPLISNNQPANRVAATALTGVRVCVRNRNTTTPTKITNHSMITIVTAINKTSRSCMLVNSIEMTIAIGSVFARSP